MIISITFGLLGSFYDKILSKPGHEDDNIHQAYLMLSDEIIYSKHIVLEVVFLSLSWFITL